MRKEDNTESAVSLGRRQRACSVCAHDQREAFVSNLSRWEMIVAAIGAIMQRQPEGEA